MQAAAVPAKDSESSIFESALTAGNSTTGRMRAPFEQDARLLSIEIAREHCLIGESQCMREIYGLLAKVAPSDSTVLIEGESGTGKELVARALHRNSSRRGNPFVVINCAAIPEALLESDLFGHERGSFTGAIAQKKGRLEIADGGAPFFWTRLAIWLPRCR